MKAKQITFIFYFLLFSSSSLALDFDKLYESWGGKPTANSQMVGQKLWNKEVIPGKNCATCHTKNLKKSGKHTKTKKTIKPLSPLVNKKSLTSVRKINKWLKRNCKFTYNRECSVDEKISFIEYIRNN